MFTKCAVVSFALLSLASATNVKQCKGMSYPDIEQNVELHDCNKLPCKLKKGTEQKISVSFTPENDLKDVKNSVNAEVLGIPLPFIGVDGLSICDKIYLENGDKASCPLKAGIKHVYKDSFPVLMFYPTITTKVEWALKDGSKNIICFEVPAKIVDKK